MSVGAVSGSGQANVAQLQRQLQKDQSAVSADRRGNASEEVQQLARAKVQHDQNLVGDATKAQAKAQEAVQAAAQAVAAGKTPVASTRPTAFTAPGQHPNGSLYL